MLNEITKWSTETFPNQTSNSVARHLNEELIELYAALDQFPPDQDGLGSIESVSEEIADCIILLCALAGVCGIDVESAVKAKHEINLTRRFEYVPKVGYHKRVRELGSPTLADDLAEVIERVRDEPF